MKEALQIRLSILQKNDINSIFMGTHEKTELPRFLIGRVAKNVIKYSRKAVLVVKENPQIYYKMTC